MERLHWQQSRSGASVLLRNLICGVHTRPAANNLICTTSVAEPSWSLENLELRFLISNAHDLNCLSRQLVSNRKAHKGFRHRNIEIHCEKEMWSYLELAAVKFGKFAWTDAQWTTSIEHVTDGTSRTWKGEVERWANKMRSRMRNKMKNKELIKIDFNLLKLAWYGSCQCVCGLSITT